MNRTAIVPVDFDGDTLDAAARDGRVWIGVRRVCESLGIDASGQIVKLKGAAWSTMELISMVAPDGVARDTSCVDLDSLPMWLATIDASRVAADAAPKLVRYQREAAKVLRAHFFGPAQVAAPPPALPAGAALRVLVAAAIDAGRLDVAAGYLALARGVVVPATVAEPVKAARSTRPYYPPVDPATDRARVLAALAGGPVAGGISALASLAGGKRVRMRRVVRELTAEGRIVRRCAGSYPGLRVTHALPATPAAEVH